MIDRVIIAEDHESANLSVQVTLKSMKLDSVDYVYYCDDALSKIKAAQSKGNSYDLLITDLQFEPDGRQQNITNGFDLISAVRKLQPGIMILVFSAEHRAAKIDSLFKVYDIDGYVTKGRNDAKELKVALEALSKRAKYYPRALQELVKQLDKFKFSDYDVRLIRLLASGHPQNQIPEYFKANDIKPSSLSSIEKRLNQIREGCGCAKNEQLVLFCKEKGII